MKKSKALFIIPSVFTMLLISVYPVIKILVDIKEIRNIYLSMGTIFYLLILILLLLFAFAEIIYLFRYLYTNKFSLKTKIIWSILLIVFNIFIIPYFYFKFVLKQEKILFPSLLYLIPMAIFLSIFMYGSNVYEKALNEKKIERKKIEEEVNIYNTKDNIVSFSFGHGYVNKEVGEYDLYVINNEKNIVFTAFTYNTDNYEQKTADEFLAKGYSDVSKDKKTFDVYKEKEVISEEDKEITTISYVGKSTSSSDCIYKISVIKYTAKPNYLVYTVSVVTKVNYDRFKNEINEILKNSKIN